MTKFKATTCASCQQTTNYAISLDRGSALTLLAMANAARRLGRNRIHLLKDMLAPSGMGVREMVTQGYLSMRMIGNASRVRYHGLIAFYAEGNTGEYVITRKGGLFLHGSAVPKVAVIDKVHSKNNGYLLEAGNITIFEALKSTDPFWNHAVTAVRGEQEELQTVLAV